jgi:hypothetical protein
VELCAGARVALDGRPCKAGHATERHCPPDQLTHRLQPSDHRIAGSLQALAGQAPHDEAGPPGGAVADHGQATLAALQHRQLRAAAGQAQCAARGATQRSRTAPERRAMQRGQGHGPAVCAHVQTAGDSPPTRMVANAVPNDPGDRAWRSPRARPATDLRGRPCEAVAAVGSDHGEAVKTGLAAGIPPSVARPLTAAQAKLGRCSQDAVRDAQATDTSQCPARARLTLRCDAVAPGRHIRSEATSAGGGGARKPQCTRRQGGRRLTRGGAEPLWEAREQRVRRRPEVRQQRQQWVAHPCGTRPRWWEAGAVLRRGREQGRTACRWTVLAYHLRRVVHRVARPRLLAALGCDGRGAGWSCGPPQANRAQGGQPYRLMGGTQYGRVGRLSLGRARQSSWAGERGPETEENLQWRVLTQSGAAPDCLQPPLVPRFGFRQQVSARVIAPRKLGVSGRVKVPVG